MKALLTVLFIAYVFIFVTGYAALRMHGKEKSKEVCEKLMIEAAEHLVLIPLLAPGEGNACLDMGYYPKEAKK